MDVAYAKSLGVPIDDPDQFMLVQPPTFEKGLDVLAPRGTMALFGQSSGTVGPIDPQVLNTKGSIFLTRPSLFAYVASRDEPPPTTDRTGFGPK